MIKACFSSLATLTENKDQNTGYIGVHIASDNDRSLNSGLQVIMQ